MATIKKIWALALLVLLSGCPLPGPWLPVAPDLAAPDFSGHSPGTTVSPAPGALVANVRSARNWDAAFSRRSGWVGGDVAASLSIPGNRVLWVFGDSWVGQVEGSRRIATALVNNSIGIHPRDPDDPGRPPRRDDLEFHWGPRGTDGQPTAWLPAPDGQWYWPTGGAVVLPTAGGPRLAVFLLVLRRSPGNNTLWCFDCVGSAVAMVDEVAGPVGDWRPRVVGLPHEPSPGVEVDWGVEALYESERDDAGYVYIYGTASMIEGRRNLVLARVRPDRLENFEDWQFWADGEWLPTPAQARPVVRDVASEMSIDRQTQGHARYVMVMSEPMLGDRILIRFAPAPAGPWSEPLAVFRVPEVQGNPKLFTYAAKSHADLSDPGSLLLSYVVNSHDFGEMARDATIYRPRFLTVSMPELE